MHTVYNFIHYKNNNNNTLFVGGETFHIKYDEIDLTCETLQCTVSDKCVFVKLRDNKANKENLSLTLNDKIFTWTDASTKLFLDLYKEKKQLLYNKKIKTKKILWQTISDGMKKLGFQVTTLQVENKWKSLEKTYKNMITNNKQTGRGRMTCAYET